MVFPPVQITGGQGQSVQAITPFWEVSNTGSLAGWHLVLHVSDYNDGMGHTILLRNLSVQMRTEEITALEDSMGTVVSLAETLAVFSPQGVVLLSAPVGGGVGIFRFAPHFTLWIPREVVGGYCRAVITLTLVSGL